MRYFYIGLFALIGMGFSLFFLAGKFVEMDTALRMCGDTNEYYIRELVKANKKIKQADSIIEVNIIFNPEDTIWQSK